MKVFSNGVGMRRPHPAAPCDCVVTITENEHGYEGKAMSIEVDGSHKGFLYQDVRFHEPGKMSCSDIIDALGEDAIIGTSFSAKLVDIVDGPNGRKMANVEIDIPQLNTTTTTKERKDKTTMTMKKTIATPASDEVIIKLLSAKGGARSDEGVAIALVDGTTITYSKNERYAPDVVGAGSSAEAPDVPVEFVKAKDGRIVVVANNLKCKDGTVKERAAVGFVMDKVPFSAADINKERAKHSLEPVVDDVISFQDLMKALDKGNAMTASIRGSHQLLNMVIEVKMEPDKSLMETQKQLEKIGCSKKRVHATNTYLGKCGWTQEQTNIFWQHFARLHADHAIYQEDNLEFNFIDDQGALWAMFCSFIKQVGSIIVGPPATGKDCAIDVLCRLLGIRAVHQVADGNMDADILIGMTGIANDNGVGVTKFEPSALMENLDQRDKEYITLFVLDEANMANPDQFVVLNELLNIEWPMEVLEGKERGTKTVSFTRGGDRVVSPEFRMFMTMNLDLEGCKTFNQATWTRLDTIVFKQSCGMKEVLLREYPALSNKDAVMADRLWDAIKNEAKNSGEEDVTEVGPRNFKSAARDVLLFGTPMAEALKKWVLTKISVVEIREAMERILAAY